MWGNFFEIYFTPAIYFQNFLGRQLFSFIVHFGSAQTIFGPRDLFKVDYPTLGRSRRRVFIIGLSLSCVWDTMKQRSPCYNLVVVARRGSPFERRAFDLSQWDAVRPLDGLVAPDVVGVVSCRGVGSAPSPSRPWVPGPQGKMSDDKCPARF